MLLIQRKEMERFQAYLQERECSGATVTKYMHDVGVLASFCDGQITGKGTLIAFKKDLQAKDYAAASINSMLAAVNRFLDFAGFPQWKLRRLKVQRTIFSVKERELTQQDYEKLLKAARSEGDERLELLVQTIAATGIRVSEVQAVTVESLRKRLAMIHNKGKIRTILLPKKLCKDLAVYCRVRGIRHGPVFVTRSGRPLDRSNIWGMMKRLAVRAKVEAKKVFPHNLRHLFARTYYKKYKDIVRLADILGHASIDTTRIYTTRTSIEQQRQIEHLPLLI